MTAYGQCYKCGTDTGNYDSKAKRWECSACGKPPDPAPPKIMKLIRSGRWDWIEKTDGQGRLHKVGVRRISNGEERWF